MQLIVDVDNIDIERNMSTIEQEPLNEKFLTSKAIDHIADDITTGNKENIQKQENIILDVGEENVIDTDKEVTTSGNEILANNLNEEKLIEDKIDTEDFQSPEEIIEDKNIKDDPEQVPETQITDNVIENVNKEESPLEEDETKLEESNKTDITETELRIENKNETDIVILDQSDTGNASVEEIDFMKTSTELNEENENELDKEVDISELSTELNQEKEMDLHKEVDISELSTELNQEKEMDLNKEVDIAEVSTVLNKEHVMEVDDAVDTVTEKELEKKCMSNENPNTSLDNKTEEAECSETKLAPINDTNENNAAIEIDDEDEKPSEQCSKSGLKDQQVSENVDKSDGIESIEETDKSGQEDTTAKKPSQEPAPPKRICGLSNNLDIFSDEEDDHPDEESPKDNVQSITEKQCINIDDDDDIMLIDEDPSTKDSKRKENSIEVEDTNSDSNNVESVPENTNQPENEMNSCIESKQVTIAAEETLPSEAETKEVVALPNETPVTETNKMAVDKPAEKEEIKKPLLPKNFINTCKKNLSDMTRNDLEEFCILKIVESVVDRSNLGEIKTHLKNLTQTMEECKKKCLMLSKQNKDLQVVLKSVQEEQKSGSDVHITPLKITRSVGMQVVMVPEKNNVRKKPINGIGSQAPVPNNNNKQIKNQQIQNARNQKEKAPINQQIPVPRLVPAAPPLVKANQANTIATPIKQINNTALPNGMRNSPPVQKMSEKRPRSQSVTVDLTDDEPPAKLQNIQRAPVNQPMRVLTTGPNLIPTQRFNQTMNSPRKVYIPISGPQAQNVRPGQTIMLKTLTGLGPRPRAPSQALITKSPQTPSPVRFARGQANRHPAPLPDAMKQYQPPNWKSLPPAPDLKLSKVENGIVISWKIDGYQEDNHEEIASYQLYAYQETSSPPSTTLWKKIGDVKALPLPMACTLTQFMAGYKYYFAVRAVDIRSRFGPFSLPGSILLLNKM